MTALVRRSIGAIFLAGILAIASTTAVHAQAQYDDAKLESFVTAAIAVNALVEQWTPRIQNAENESQAAELRTQANEELKAAIEATQGITVEEYREIGRAIQGDPELMGRVAKIYDARVAE